jgi:hypothetical protein
MASKPPVFVKEQSTLRFSDKPRLVRFTIKKGKLILSPEGNSCFKSYFKGARRFGKSHKPLFPFMPTM